MRYLVLNGAVALHTFGVGGSCVGYRQLESVFSGRVLSLLPPGVYSSALYLTFRM